ncbi:MAG: DUF2971 domain-containing protein [Sedimentisphaerales bacterium]
MQNTEHRTQNTGDRRKSNPPKAGKRRIKLYNHCSMQIKKENIKNIDENELDNVVWRYLTFPKFISLLVYGALWFPKLNILQDQFEGYIPSKVQNKMHNEHQKLKKLFHPDLHQQIDEMLIKNVKDGRELTVVNCWFLGEHESKQMWDEYVGSTEGVAIKSTIRKLSTYIYVYPEFSHIGKVKYVDLSSYELSSYEANQAHERAFLKDKNKYSHENEVRITSMSIKTPTCVNINGKPLTTEEYSGKNMNNFENAGLYIRVNLPELIDTIVLSPNVPEWFELLIKRIMQLSNLAITIKRSGLEKTNA